MLQVVKLIVKNGSNYIEQLLSRKIGVCKFKKELFIMASHRHTLLCL